MTAVKKLFDEAAIAKRVKELATEIADAIAGDFTIVSLLKGSFVFTADLVRALDARGCHPLIDFVWLSSYGQGRESSGAVRLIGKAPSDLEGRQVLLIDDVADSGHTLAFAKTLLEQAGAAKVWICALLDKPSRRQITVGVDFVGFTVGDVFVVGYGIDFAERWRHLPYIGAVD